jgi:predicted metallopeptidase
MAIAPTWEDAPDLRELAVKIIEKRDEVSHVDISEVLFLRELDTKPSAMARCWRLVGHPIGFFTKARFAITLYWQWCDTLNENQLKILIMHEMMHIPPTGDKLIDHNVKDFREILGIDLDWSMPGREAPDILLE